MKMTNSLSILALVLLGGVATARAAPATIAISTKGQEMAFDKQALSAKAGQKVKLTFKNASGMQHNFVVVKPGTADAVAKAGLSAGFNAGWFKPTADVIANTKMLDGGKSETIEFTAPATPGDYPFICTFPGHTSMMRGILKVSK
jgi:azurin